MIYKSKELPSFMRIKYLKDMEAKNKLHYIRVNKKVAGFYVLDGSMFKCLYIEPKYRGANLASVIIKDTCKKQKITIATLVKRNCCIKHIIKKLGFTPTGIIVQGKQSLLEIWESPSL